MSDPVSNSEIEDVLASIRRLVSENAKALKGDRTRDPEAQKLVLTPALRIDETDAQAAPSDVFAVDTDTWNDVSREAEASESKGIFSHRAQSSEAVSKAVGEGAAPVEPSEAPVAEAADETLPAPGTGAESAASKPGETDGASVAAAPAQSEDAAVPVDGAQAGTESPKPASPAATALEQRIAELETAMDLRPKTQEAPARDTVPERSGAAEAEAASEAPAAAAPAAEAPPKSWIEGLVAAAAAAEATRLAERNKARAAAQAAAAPPAEAVTGDETADQAEAEPVVEAADAGPLELTDADAVVSEPEGAESDTVSEETRHADEVEEPVDEVEDAITAEADEGAAEVATDAGAQDVETAPAAAEATTAGPERSWVDRLIAAAATLRDAPEKGEAEASAEDIAAAAQDGAVAAEAQPEEDLKEVIEEAADDAGEAGDVPLTLEPLNLVDPIAVEAETGGEAEAEDVAVAEAEAEADPETETSAAAAALEWEEVSPPDLDAAEEDEEAKEPLVEVDTVLTGPWTAAAVARDAETAEELAEDLTEETAEDLAEDTADAPVEAEGAPTPDAADAAASAEEVPVGALEWEPVSPPEAPTDAVEEAAQDTVTDPAAIEQDDIDQEPQDIDRQEETVPSFDAASMEEDTEDDTEGFDEDAAAVAAAAEAEVDWEGAGLAAAGVASASSFYDETEAEAEYEEAEAEDAAGTADAPEAEADTGTDTDVAAPRRDLVDETVIDEAMLRELVAQIVRDELQGTVGERITHNVRRLIRREIARALTLQDLEK